MASARDERLDEPRPAAVLVRDARHEDDRDDGQADADEDERRRQAFEQEAGGDRDDRGEHAGDRRDDAHPADRQPAIQGRDADAAQGAREHAQQEVGAARDGLAADDGDHQREGHADELRQQDDAEHRGAPAGQPAAEVPGTPGDGRGQPEQDGRRAAGQGVDQAAPSTDGAAAEGRVLDAAVHGGRAGQLDDGVGRAVVAIRRRQVDDLEVGGDPLEQVERAGRASVVEGHERVVEDERRAPVAGDQPNEAQPRREVHQVERALAEAGDRDPVAELGGEDLDVEGLVVDPDAAVATAGHLGDVADHVALEVARRRLHRRDLGPLDPLERRVEDPMAALEHAELLAPHRQPFGLAGDLLGVDGVRLDAGTGVGLVVARALQGALRVADLDLEPLAGSRLLGDRPERLEGAGLLLDLERGRVAQRRQGLAWLLADEAVELGRQLVHPGDMRLLAGEQVLGRREVVEPQRRRAAVRCRPRPGAAPPRSRIGRAAAGRSRRRGAAPASGSCRRSQNATSARMTPIPAMAAAEVHEAAVPKLTSPMSCSSRKAPTASDQTDDHGDDRAQREIGCQVGSGFDLELDLDLAGQGGVELPDLRSRAARSLVTAARTSGSGFGDGWVWRERVELGRDRRPPSR